MLIIIQLCLYFMLMLRIIQLYLSSIQKSKTKLFIIAVLFFDLDFRNQLDFYGGIISYVFLVVAVITNDITIPIFF